MENLKIRGIATLTFTDKVTGKVRVREVENIAPLVANNILRKSQYVTGYSPYGSLIRLNSVTYTRLGLSDQPIGDSDNPAVRRIHYHTVGTKLAGSIGEPSEFVRTFDSDWRFNPTSNAKTITVIGLIQDVVSSVYGLSMTYVKIEPAETQQPNENLDIKYRLIMELPNDSSKVLYYGALASETNTGGSVHHGVKFSSMKFNPKLRWCITQETSTSDLVTSGNTSTANLSFPRYDNIGTMVKSVNSNKIANSTYANRSHPLAKALNGVIDHPLFNHKPGSALWYEDVAYLARSQGSVIKESRDSFLTGEEADMHLITVTKSGQTGVARYDYQLSPIFGGINSTMIPRGSHCTLHDTTVDFPDVVHRMPHTDMTTPSKNNLNERSSAEYNYYYDFKYSNDTIVTSSASSITIFNLPGNDVIVFDANSTSPLQSTPKKTITRNNAGDIFVTTTESKLIKIVNKTTLSLVDLPLTVGEISAIGHCPTTDKIWAFNEKGMHWSDDSGVTWTSMGLWTSPSGSTVTPADISSLAVSVIVGKENELAIIYKTNPTSAYSAGVWYDGLNNTVSALGYSGSIKSSLAHYEKLWMIYSGSYVKLVKWNDATKLRSILNTSSSKGNSPLYAIDHIGNNVVLTSNASDNYVGAHQQYNFDVKGKLLGSVYVYNNYFDKMGSMTCRYMEVDGSVNTGLNYYNDLTTDYSRSFKAAIGYNRSGLTYGPNGLSNQVNKQSGSVSDYFKGARYRWDNANSVWKHNWWNTAQDSVGTAHMQRKGFFTDDHTFNGYAFSIIPMSTMTSFSFLTTIVPQDKDRNPNAPTPASLIYAHPQDYDRTIFDLVGTGSVTLVWEDESGNMVLIDATDPNNIVETVLQVKADNTEHFVAVTLSGTALLVYLDGVSIGNISLTNAPVLNNTATLCVGSKFYEHYLDVEYKYHFFRGTMSNIQLFDKVVSPADITAHNLDRQGLVSSIGLNSRYLLTEDLMEGKVTSTTFEQLPFGLSFKFGDSADPLITESFIKDDYYNSALVKDGFLQDNISTWDLKYSRSQYPTTPIDVLTFPTGVAQRLPLLYGRTYGSTVVSNSFWSTNNYTEALGRNYGAIGFTGDVDYEFTICQLSATINVGIVSTANAVPNTRDLSFVVEIRSEGTDTIQVRTNGASTGTVYNAVINDGTKCKVSYVESTGEASFYVEELGVWVQYGVTETIGALGGVTAFTSLEKYNGNVPVTPSSTYAVASLSDNFMTGIMPSNMVIIGDSVNGTGVFKKDAIGFDRNFIPRYNIYLDGVSAIINFIDATADKTVIGNEPTAAGEVTLYVSGIILLHSSDVGKAVTVSGFDVLHLGAS